MQLTIEQHAPECIWTAVIRAHLEKTAEPDFVDSIELRFVGSDVLQLTRRSFDDYYILEGTQPPAHRLINVPFKNRFTTTNDAKEVEVSLRIFLEEAECKMLIIKFDESDIRLHLLKEDGTLVIWAETHDEEIHHRETVPSIKLTTPNASA